MRKISEQELKDILDKHGKWLRQEDGGERADLNSADLRYADFRSANLSCADLRYADLNSADLRYADFRSANLSCADLRYADLSDADLRYADLRSANLSCADLRYANLNSADLRFANLITFQMQRHQAFYTFDGSLRIGCLVMPVTEWALGFEEIGKKYEYTNEQIKAYGVFINLCLNHFKNQKGGGE